MEALASQALHLRLGARAVSGEAPNQHPHPQFPPEDTLLLHMAGTPLVSPAGGQPHAYHHPAVASRQEGVWVVMGGSRRAGPVLQARPVWVPTSLTLPGRDLQPHLVTIQWPLLRPPTGDWLVSTPWTIPSSGPCCDF